MHYKQISVITVISLGVLLGGCSGNVPDHLGAEQERLAPCPSSPNCVSSQATDPSQQVAAFTADSDDYQAWQRWQTVIAQYPRTTLITVTDTYLHAEFRSRWLGFVDDVELLRDPEQALIHVRSASRLGYSDLGVNRRRVEHLRQAFAQ